ncbi:DNA alkylation repair protein [Phragmitibacter flavus]|uniref:DNA alkylation repair protein n=1 Tax=Phragmitibacter flavus TaxID=2576071 RepID=A0A5R8KK20_9BACT|nr:DNA alkylation repair protein [Phragmitibacter flavus]TLD72285.1 DNA alkylation repair protein [Phragmitibacter flavus]
MKKKGATTVETEWTARQLEEAVATILIWLEEHRSDNVRAGMARYAIPAEKALGISVGDLRRYAKLLGRDQRLSEALWKTDVYEARMLAVFVGDPLKVSAKVMDEWCGDFDSWAICDTACFHLFDQTPHALKKIFKWAKEKGEFQKRAAFALLASAGDLSVEENLRCLPLIGKAAGDERNFVKKGVSWALRAMGSRHATLHAAALEMAERLVESESASARWIGRDALRFLKSAATLRRLEAKSRASRVAV